MDATLIGVIAALEGLVNDLKAARSDDYLCRLRVQKDPATGQWTATLFSDDGFGNGNEIATINFPAEPLEPWTPIQQAFREYNAAHAENDIAHQVAIPEIDPVSPGFERQWLRCRTCQRVYHYDYQPFSLSNPILWTQCGHAGGRRDLNCDRISESEALDSLASQSSGGAS